MTGKANNQLPLPSKCVAILIQWPIYLCALGADELYSFSGQ